MEKLEELRIKYAEFIQKQSEYNDKIRSGEARGFFKIDNDRLNQMELCATDHSYDPLGINNNGISGIFELINNNDIDTLDKYLVYGCPLTVTNEDGLTPLELAVKLENKEAIEMIEKKLKI